jgi:superfamily II DNA or RNA helicase
METKQSKHIHNTDIVVPYNSETYKSVKKSRYNPYSFEPIKTAAEYCFVMRQIVNSDRSRIDIVKELARKHRRVIVFYNFDYELELLRTIDLFEDFVIAEYNGHTHQDVPKTLNWIYLVQYIAGAEGWNCIEANTVIFYSLNYSYKITTQAAGRIDRINSPYLHLFYYFLKSDAQIDKDIMGAYLLKRRFNEFEHAKREGLDLA